MSGERSERDEPARDERSGAAAGRDAAPGEPTSAADEAKQSLADGLSLARSALAAARGGRGLPGRGGPTGGRSGGTGPAGDGGTEVQGRDGQVRRRRRRVVLDEDEIPFSGARPDARDPQRVESVLDRLRAERGWTQPLAGGEVVGRWAEIVGPELAAHVTADGIDGTSLTVHTDSTAWATQVRMLVPTLLTRIADVVGPGVVTAVVVRGPAAPSWRKGGLHVRGRGPRDTYG